MQILTSAKRLADATDHIVECAKACESNSTNLDSWEQVEWDRMDALRSASVNIKNNFGRDPDNQWQILLKSYVPIDTNINGIVHHDSEDHLVAKTSL